MNKYKSLKKLIKDVCANWDLGKCLGATLLNTGLFNTTGKCLIMDKFPCPYFEKCIIPDIKDQALINKYGKINKAYSINKIRKCKCGEVLKPRRRYCDKCNQKLKRMNWKLSKQRIRKNTNSMSTVKQISVPVNAYK